MRGKTVRLWHANPVVKCSWHHYDDHLSLTKVFHSTPTKKFYSYRNKQRRRRRRRRSRSRVYFHRHRHWHCGFCGAPWGSLWWIKVKLLGWGLRRASSAAVSSPPFLCRGAPHTHRSSSTLVNTNLSQPLSASYRISLGHPNTSLCNFGLDFFFLNCLHKSPSWRSLAHHQACHVIDLQWVV